MNTIRPIKRFDSVNSNRASAEFIVGKRASSDGNSIRSYLDPTRDPAQRSPLISPRTPQEVKEAHMGRLLVGEVITPAIEVVSLLSVLQTA